MSGGRKGQPRPDNDFSGIWTFAEVAKRKLAGTWPVLGQVLRLNFNGADGSTEFIDESGHAVTANGNAQIDTSQSLSGGSSGKFDGSGDYLSLADSPDWDFGTGDFGINIGVRFAALTGVMTLIGNYDAGTSGWYLQYRNDGSNRLTLGVTGDSPQFDFAWTPSVDTWYRIKTFRVGTDLVSLVNGAQIGTTQTMSTNISGSTAPLWVGGLNFSSGVQFLNGWMDDVLVTKGVA